mmetsp:Transcript_20679/g.37571  ORF Transcript_20679/g.37571 Transcript_20679/m.37571 type:complete len:209 (+) Transcript_20679:188-814(+)
MVKLKIIFQFKYEMFFSRLERGKTQIRTRGAAEGIPFCTVSARTRLDFLFRFLPCFQFRTATSTIITGLSSSTIILVFSCSFRNGRRRRQQTTSVLLLIQQSVFINQVTIIQRYFLQSHWRSIGNCLLLCSNQDTTAVCFSSFRSATQSCEKKRSVNWLQISSLSTFDVYRNGCSRRHGRDPCRKFHGIIHFLQLRSVDNKFEIVNRG